MATSVVCPVCQRTITLWQERGFVTVQLRGDCDCGVIVRISSHVTMDVSGEKKLPPEQWTAS